VWIILLAVLVMILAALVVVQAWMLLSNGWTVPIGSVADWLQAVATVAAFGALLFYASREWGRGQLERRDREADQARLIVMGLAE
jgi:polyferredoxin